MASSIHVFITARVFAEPAPREWKGFILLKIMLLPASLISLRSFHPALFRAVFVSFVASLCDRAFVTSILSEETRYRFEDSASLKEVDRFSAGNFSRRGRTPRSRLMLTRWAPTVFSSPPRVFAQPVICSLFQRSRTLCPDPPFCNFRDPSALST